MIKSIFLYSAQNSLINGKLEWADEYFAVSVSESKLDKVRDYIKNQEAHHQNISFQSEYKDFLKKAGFDIHG